MTVSFSYSPGWTDTFSWTVYVGFVICFLLAFGMGANDTANSYGTVVGAGVLKLWHAYVLATIFEIAGAGLLGYKVTETIRTGIVDISVYNIYSKKNGNIYQIVPNCTIQTNCSWPTCCNEYSGADLLLGELGALSGTAFWLIAASLFKMPVSATQSVVGGTIGFSLVLKGATGINWMGLVKIVISWVASPLLAGFFSVIFYLIIKFTVFKKQNQMQASLRSIPVWFWFTLTVNFFTIFYDGSKYLSFDKLSWWLSLIISFAIGLLVGLFMWFFGNKWVEKRARILQVQERGKTNEEVFFEEDDLRKCADGRKVSLRLETFDREPRRIGPRSRRAETFKRISSVSDTIDIKPRAFTAQDAMITFGPVVMDLQPIPEENAPYTPHVSESSASPHTSCDSGSSAFPLTQNMQRPNKFKQFIKKIRSPVVEDSAVVNVFNYLQILSACFLAFSHGSNDAANSVGPLVGLYLAWKYGLATVNATSNIAMELIILYGAASSMVGLYVLGHKVIKTIGKDLTDVNAPSGFAMSLGTAFTVLFASKVGIPVSTTHCMVGAVLFVGMTRSNTEGVSWKIFRNIAFAWLVTTPVAGLVSALVAYLLAHFILGTV